MTDSLLNILKFTLLALLYLFFARVLWAVWSEVSGPRPGSAPVPASAKVAAPVDANPSMPAPGTVGTPAATKAPRRPPKGKKGTVARLIVLEPKVRKGAAIGLANEVTFGRAPGCAISVPDDTFVSQVHARVYNDHTNVVIEDLNSTNGTYVNANRINAPQILHRGDRIQIGSIVLEAD
jgi:hypothetical protein